MSSNVPEGANEDCPGATSDTAGKAASCEGCPNQSACASGAGRQVDPAVEMVAHRLSSVKHIILVLSGKGGVGKSTFSAQLAFTLAAHGRSVGLLDVDICGPSVPRMLGLVGAKVHQSASGWSPVWLDENLGVMSIGFMLPNNDDAIIWRGPRKNALIQQFLTDVDWGTLDYLIVDTPPGTSDEHISMVQLLKGCGSSAADGAASEGAAMDGAAATAAARPVPTVGAVVVTTPQEVAMSDVRKELNFCKKVSLPVVGVVENMSGYLCPCCGHKADIFPAAGDGPAGMAERFQVPFLGALPIDPLLLQSCEAGEAYVVRHAEAKGVPAFMGVVTRIAQHVEGPHAAPLRRNGAEEDGKGEEASVAKAQ